MCSKGEDTVAREESVASRARTPRHRNVNASQSQCECIAMWMHRNVNALQCQCIAIYMAQSTPFINHSRINTIHTWMNRTSIPLTHEYHPNLHGTMYTSHSLPGRSRTPTHSWVTPMHSRVTHSSTRGMTCAIYLAMHSLRCFHLHSVNSPTHNVNAWQCIQGYHKVPRGVYGVQSIAPCLPHICLPHMCVMQPIPPCPPHTHSRHTFTLYILSTTHLIHIYHTSTTHLPHIYHTSTTHLPHIQYYTCNHLSTTHPIMAYRLPSCSYTHHTNTHTPTHTHKQTHAKKQTRHSASISTHQLFTGMYGTHYLWCPHPAYLPPPSQPPTPTHCSDKHTYTHTATRRAWQTHSRLEIDSVSWDRHRQTWDRQRQTDGPNTQRTHED